MTRYVYICSPCRGDYENNIENAITYCAAAFARGVIPIAPHIYFTRFMDDRNEEDRRRGMEAGKRALLSCSEVWVFGLDRPSEGMQEEIALAIRNDIPVRDGNEMILRGTSELKTRPMTAEEIEKFKKMLAECPIGTITSGEEGVACHITVTARPAKHRRLGGKR